MSGACFRRWGSGRDETPWVSTSQTGTAILNLPVPLGVQPGTIGGPLLALVFTVQPIPARRKYRPLASASRECPYKTAGVRTASPLHEIMRVNSLLRGSQ
jgi:hypothetical protein